MLAGDRGPTDPVAQARGVGTKAFAPLAGRPMIDYVLDTLRAAPGIGDIHVQIAEDAPALPDDVTRLAAAASPAASVAAAFEHTGAPLFVTTADNPLLTVEMIADFLRDAEATGADVVAGMALRPVVERAGNPGRRTYIRFSDGEVSGCNLFAMTTPRAASGAAYFRRLEQDRKKPLKMARKVGLWPLLKLALGLMSRAGAAAAIARRAGCSMAIVTVNHPEAAHDVDKASDIEFVERRLMERQGARDGAAASAGY